MTIDPKEIERVQQLKAHARPRKPTVRGPLQLGGTPFAPGILMYTYEGGSVIEYRAGFMGEAQLFAEAYRLAEIVVEQADLLSHYRASSHASDVETEEKDNEIESLRAQLNEKIEYIQEMAEIERRWPWIIKELENGHR